MSAGRTLPRYTMGVFAVMTAGVLASSPWTVLIGGIPTQLRQTGVAGVPLAFLVVMVVVGLMAVGFVAVSRHVPHGAPFYAQLAHGLGPQLGLVAAAVAFVGYTALQVSLYGLFGQTVADLFGGQWWWYAAVGWLAVLTLGRYPGAVNAKFLGVLMALEIAVIGLFIVAGFAHPAAGAVSFAVFQPSSLLVPGVASVGVFTVAAFAGVETALSYGEEAKSRKALVIGAVAAIVLCGILYSLASWAYVGWLGYGDLKRAAGAEANQPLELLGDIYGGGIIGLAIVLLLTSVFAAKVAFHNAISRYVFALAREGVLFKSWSEMSSGRDGGAPVGGSVVQALTAAAALVVFLAFDADPLKTVFTWSSTVGALCVLLLLAASSWSALAYFDRGRGRGGGESVWIRQILPFGGGIAGVLGVAFAASSLGDLLGTPPGSSRPWLVAVPIGAAVLIALVAGTCLRTFRPEVYRGIGYGVPDAATALDDDLTEIEL